LSELATFIFVISVKLSQLTSQSKSYHLA